MDTNCKWSYNKTTIEGIRSFCTLLFTILSYHIKNSRHIKKQLLTMVAKFISKTENIDWGQRKAQFQKAYKLMENGTWNDMLYGRNKAISLDCSIKHFLIPNIVRAMTLITHFNTVLKANLSFYLIKSKYVYLLYSLIFNLLWQQHRVTIHYYKLQLPNHLPSSKDCWWHQVLVHVWKNCNLRLSFLYSMCIKKTWFTESVVKTSHDSWKLFQQPILKTSNNLVYLCNTNNLCLKT